MVKKVGPKFDFVSAFIFLFVVFAIPLTYYFGVLRPQEIRKKASVENVLVVCPTGLPGNNACDNTPYVGAIGIQGAIDAAPDGTKILIKSGTYTVTAPTIRDYVLNGTTYAVKTAVYIENKSITLSGEANTVIDLNKTQHGIRLLNAKNSTIENLTIMNGGGDDTTGKRGVGVLVNQKTATSDTVKVRNCVVKDMNQALTAGQTPYNWGIAIDFFARAIIKNNEIANITGYGVGAFDSAQLTLINNKMHDITRDAVNQQHQSTGQIANNLIYNIGENGITSTHSSKMDVTNNTIYNIGTGQIGNEIYYGGVYVKDTAHAEVNNNIFAHFKRLNDYDKVHGIFTFNEASANANYNLFFDIDNNAMRAWGGTIGGGVGIVALDPKFLSAATGDFHLETGSPAIDAGDPSILDADGSRSDMGAFGGPDACGLDASLPGCAAVATSTPTVTPPFATPSATLTPPVATATPPLTLTPTVTPPATPTPLPGTFSKTILLKLKGVEPIEDTAINDYRQGDGKLMVTYTIYKKSNPAESVTKEGQAAIYDPATSFYHVFLANIPNAFATGSNMLIKGNKHLRAKFCHIGQAVRCDEELDASQPEGISFLSGDILNLASYPLLPGDVNQDTVLNGVDLTGMIQELGKLPQDRDLKFDLNYDKMVRGDDYGLMIGSVEVFDDE